ncbi:MAG: BACON domain-containing carbohydrate-binding protein [Rikenellaceae bacterium]
MKNNSFFRTLVAMLTMVVLSFFATNCTDDTDVTSGTPTLTVSTSIIAFDSEGAASDDNNGQLYITSNREWTATAASDGDWLTIDPTEGSGNGTITMSMSAYTGSKRYATIKIEIYNTYGVLAEENVTVTQSGTGAVADANILFDGSELPTAYSTNEAISVGGYSFVVTSVANYSGSYTTTGPIQFKAGVGVMYNSQAVDNLSALVIELSNSYNNFTVYSGTSANPSTNAIEGVTTKAGDVISYAIPAGDTYVTICNEVEANTAYANGIEFVLGDNESDLAEGSTGDDDGDDQDGDVDTTGDVLYSFDLSTISSTASTSDANFTNESVEFVVNNAYYDTSYSNTTIYEDGYIYNTTALSGDIVTLALQYNSSTTSYQTATVYAGTSQNPTTELTTKYTDGAYVYYAVPAGSTYFKVVSSSGYIRLYTIQLLGEGDGTSSDSDDSVGSENAIFTTFGDELPTSYPTDDTTITMGGYEFVINQVANYSSSNGAFQVKANAGYAYNTSAISGLAVLVFDITNTYYDVITNNFILYAGTASNPTTDIVTPVVSTDAPTKFVYFLPDGCEYITIAGGSYAAYANSIAFYTVSGAAADGYDSDYGTDDGSDDGSDDGDTTTPTSNALITVEASNLPTAYPTSDTTLEMGDYDFTMYYVAHFSNSGKMQFKSGQGYIYNTTGVSDLKAIVLADASNLIVYAGTSANPTAGTALTAEVVGTNSVYYVPSGSTYFAVVAGSSVGYATSLKVYNSTGATAEGFTGSYTEPTAPTYTVVTPTNFYSSVATGDLVTVEGVTVDFVSGSTAIVSANGDSMLIYSSGHGLAVGDVATISGTVSAYKNALQLGSVTVTDKVSGGSSTITPMEYTIADLSSSIESNHMTYVKLTGVTLGVDDKTLTYSDGTTEIAGYNNYSIEIPADYTTYTVIGYVYISDNGDQIYPTSIVGEGEQTVDPNAGTTVTYAVEDVFPVIDGQTTASSAAGSYVELTATDGYTSTDGFNFVFGGSSTTTVRTWYSGGWQLRVYGGYTMTITAPEGKVMTEISFGGSDLTATTKITVEDGTYTTGKWSGSANSVVFTIVASTPKITSIEITYADAE